MILILIIIVTAFICAFLLEKLIRFVFNNCYIYSKKDWYSRESSKIITNRKLNVDQMLEQIGKLNKLDNRRIRKQKLNKLYEINR